MHRSFDNEFRAIREVHIECRLKKKVFLEQQRLDGEYSDVVDRDLASQKKKRPSTEVQKSRHMADVYETVLNGNRVPPTVLMGIR